MRSPIPSAIRAPLPIHLGVLALLALPLLACAESADAGPRRGIWIDPEVLAALPTEGFAWDYVLSKAERVIGVPDLSNQDDPTNVLVMAKGLVYARTGDARYRADVIRACMSAIGSEAGGRTLALGRELAAYVIAADLVGLPEAEDVRFRRWLELVRRRTLSGRTLISTHEDRPNNWGTHAGASRLAVALYLEDRDDVERAARVFRGWLGDRTAYAGFKYGKDLSWHADADAPVGINPVGSVRHALSLDGVLPDDQRRGGPFRWPPPRENYVYGALQGAIAQAVLLDRAGYHPFEWENRALLRAYRWLHEQANYPPTRDDRWQLHVVNFHYGTDYPAPPDAPPGKNVGWTGWTHGTRIRTQAGP